MSLKQGGAIDERLALVNLLLGRQRPHYNRLAQAFAWIWRGGPGETKA